MSRGAWVMAVWLKRKDVGRSSSLLPAVVNLGPPGPPDAIMRDAQAGAVRMVRSSRRNGQR